MPKNHASDPWSAGVAEALTNAKESGTPTVLGPDWMSGATPNHLEQQLSKMASQHFASAADPIVQWYAKDLFEVGDQAKGGTDEAIFSKSHGGHYFGARGPILYFSLRAAHRAAIDAMVRVWKGTIAAYGLLRDNKSVIVAPGARFTPEADQRVECSTTCAWLNARGSNGRPPRTPPVKNLAAVTWLSLYAFTLLDAHAKAGTSWAAEWPEILREVGGAGLGDLLPLKNPLVVERGPRGHVAHFETWNKMGNPAHWAAADYAKGTKTYGVLPGTNTAGYDPVIQVGPVPPCPGGPGAVTRFPVAGGRVATVEGV